MAGKVKVPLKTRSASIHTRTTTDAAMTPTSGITATAISDATAFHRLAEQWRKERGATSSITKMAMCPAYQKIIAMGPRAIPLILRQMESEGDQPDMWFWALRVLTDQDPVSEADRGNVVRMAQAWLGWGRQRYVWLEHSS